jgi:hypothetical protein
VRYIFQLIAILLTLYLLQAALFMIPFWFNGGFRAQIQEGLLGVIAIAGMLWALIVGPYTALSLWRSQRIALYLMAGHFAFALAHGVATLLLGVSDETALPRTIFSAATIAFFLSPSARRACPV